MSKLIVFEKTNVMKIRLEKILKELELTDVYFYQNNLFSFDQVFSNRDPFDSIIIDYEQFSEELNLIIESLNTYTDSFHVKILLLVSHINKDEMLQFYSKGIDEILLKPFSDEILFEKFKGLQNGVSSFIFDFRGKNNIKGGKIMLTWCKDFEIGIDQIDQEHKSIIEHFENLYALMKEGHGHEYFEELIHFLENYIHSHFEHEETIQREIHYPNYEEHKTKHEEFKAQVEEIIQLHPDFQISNEDLIKLNLFIKDWLSHHILVEDKKISAYLSENQIQ